MLDEARGALADAGPGEFVVIGDNYGALSLGAAALHAVTGIRVHQDELSGETALAHNADAAGLTGSFHSLPLGPRLLSGAKVVLLRLPRSLDALDEIAAMIDAHADQTVTIYAGGMVKHLALAMNDVLGAHFDSVRPGLARQKARVLTVTGPGSVPSPGTASARWPKGHFHQDLGLWVCAHGGAFAGTRVDIGTRFLLGILGEAKPDAASAIDLGCGTGVVAAALALARPAIRVLATDQSAAAVASAIATAAANGVAERVSVVRDDGLASQPDASAELILLNPPFHTGATVHSGLATRLFEDAARVLAPGGELWTVFNSHLGYRRTLTRIVGPTREVARNNKFTITVSTRRH
ncbi:MAG: methyltransferase [Microbacteriaceae bacterium]|nr:methyltransferase [Microbacteriaceae bacterium]